MAIHNRTIEIQGLHWKQIKELNRVMAKMKAGTLSAEDRISIQSFLNQAELHLVLGPRLDLARDAVRLLSDSYRILQGSIEWHREDFARLENGTGVSELLPYPKYYFLDKCVPLLEVGDLADIFVKTWGYWGDRIPSCPL